MDWQSYVLTSSKGIYHLSSSLGAVSCSGHESSFLSCSGQKEKGKGMTAQNSSFTPHIGFIVSNYYSTTSPFFCRVTLT